MPNSNPSGDIGGRTSSTTPGQLDPREFVTQLLAKNERDKADIARKLHDELGGLLVAAVMDVASIEKHLEASSSAGCSRLLRVRHSLNSAIDLKRRLIEELHPTLLDNVGLYAALRWQMKAICDPAGITCSDDYSTNEPLLSPETGIAVFRIVQEALLLMTRHQGVTHATLSASLQGQVLTLSLFDDGSLKCFPDATNDALAQAADRLAYSSLVHRAGTMGGAIDIRCAAEGVTLRTDLTLGT